MVPAATPLLKGRKMQERKRANKRNRTAKKHGPKWKSPGNRPLKGKIPEKRPQRVKRFRGTARRCKKRGSRVDS